MIEGPERRSRSESARSELAARIMDGRLLPGRPLRISPLSQELGMSATPVREALNLLVGERLVEYVPMRGFLVAPPPDDAQVRAMGEARSVLEPELAALSALRASPGQVEELEAIHARTTDAGVGPSYREYEDYLRASDDFHRSIAGSARSPYLSAALAAIPVHSLRFRRFGDSGVDDSAEAIAEHSLILSAIRSGDAEAARSAMARHVRAVTERA